MTRVARCGKTDGVADAMRCDAMRCDAMQAAAAARLARVAQSRRERAAPSDAVLPDIIAEADAAVAQRMSRREKSPPILVPGAHRAHTDARTHAQSLHARTCMPTDIGHAHGHGACSMRALTQSSCVVRSLGTSETRARAGRFPGTALARLGPRMGPSCLPIDRYKLR
jgi:hypothetical protein